MAPWLGVATLAALAGACLAHVIPQNPGACPSLNQRKSWNAMTLVEKAEYIRAEQCLVNHPPVTGTIEGAQTVWDELHRSHIWQGNYVHYTGHFLPWHRYLVRTHERLLQTLCHYRGAQPYWDELTDYESGPIDEASILDPIFGFGGDGVGEDKCVQDGPFRHLTLRMEKNTNYGNYCLSRALNQTLFEWAKRSNVETCNSIPDYNDAWQCYNTYPHSAGHVAIGGVMLDPLLSNGDPLFYLHHAYLDRLWWQWQQADLPKRLHEMGSANVPPQDVLGSVDLAPPDRSLVDYNGDGGPTTTMEHVLWVHGISPNVTVADVMDLRGEVICAEYV